VPTVLCGCETESLTEELGRGYEIRGFRGDEATIRGFLVFAPYSVVVGYKRFGGLCSLRLQGSLQPNGSPKCWYPTTTLHDAKTRKPRIVV